MKKLPSLFLISFLTLAFCSIHTVSFGQERDNSEERVSPNASVSQAIGTTVVTITYGRPSVNNRQVFGGLEKYGEVWRTGANESTNITFSDDVMVEDKEIKAGTYSLYTIPGKGEWTIILNSKLSWGTQYDQEQDVARVTVEPSKGEHMEQFMIYFKNVTNSSAKCILHWNTTKVPFTIKV